MIKVQMSALPATHASHTSLLTMDSDNMLTSSQTDSVVMVLSIAPSNKDQANSEVLSRRTHSGLEYLFMFPTEPAINIHRRVNRAKRRTVKAVITSHMRLKVRGCWTSGLQMLSSSWLTLHVPRDTTKLCKESAIQLLRTRATVACKENFGTSRREHIKLLQC